MEFVDRIEEQGRLKRLLSKKEPGFAIVRGRRSQIHFHEDATRQRDVLSETQVIKDIYEHMDMQIQVLNDTIVSLRSQLEKARSEKLPVEDIFRELQVQYPCIVALSLTSGIKVSGDKTSEEIRHSVGQR